MATWFAWLRFPDGRILYGHFTTYSDTFEEPLYARCVRRGEKDASGTIATRDGGDGPPLPVHRDRPRSPPEELVLVRVMLDRDGAAWSALYCPARGTLLGPRYQLQAYRLAEQVYVVSEGDREHLVAIEVEDHGDYSLPVPAATTLCGRPVATEATPFDRTRDLYADWDTRACRTCLLHPLALGREHVDA